MSELADASGKSASHPPPPALEGVAGDCLALWEGNERTQTAQDPSDSHVKAVTSRQHLIWFALRERHGKTLCERRTVDCDRTESV